MIKKVKYYFGRLILLIRMPEIRVLPGHLSYFLVLSLVPTVSLLGYVASLLGLSIDVIVDFISTGFSKEAANLFIPVVEGSKPLDFQFLTVILIGYFIASNGAHAIILSSNRIYEIKDDNYIRRRVKALIMTFFIVVLFLSLLVVPIFGSTIISWLNYLIPNDKVILGIKSIFPYAKVPITLFIIFILIKIIYTMAPDKKISSSTVNKGAMFTSIMWSGATYIYTYYAKNVARYHIFYGGLASIVILMIWIYMLSYILVMGITLNYNSEQTQIRKRKALEEKRLKEELEKLEKEKQTKKPIKENKKNEKN